ncbi:MAG: hypothetical protein V4596_00200 [Bdellovibrionota bacterium]
MKRILLISEDFNEMTFLETLLKKLGFDTLGIQNPSVAQEKAMTMNPEMLILSDFIKGQSTHQLLEAMVGYRPNMFVILMKSDVGSKTEHVGEFVNKTIKSPVDPVDFIQSVAEVAKLNVDLLLEKFYKLGLFKGIQGTEAFKVSGKVKNTPDTQYIKNLKGMAHEKGAAERKKRYAAQVSSLGEPKATNVDHKVALKEAQEFRSRLQDPEIIKIDEQRQNFVRALFKK